MTRAKGKAYADNTMRTNNNNKKKPILTDTLEGVGLSCFLSKVKGKSNTMLCVLCRWSKCWQSSIRSQLVWTASRLALEEEEAEVVEVVVVLLPPLRTTLVPTVRRDNVFCSLFSSFLLFLSLFASLRLPFPVYIFLLPFFLSPLFRSFSFFFFFLSPPRVGTR